VLLTPVGRRLAPWWAATWVVVALVTLGTPESWALHAHRVGAWLTAGALVAVIGVMAVLWPRVDRPPRRAIVIAVVAVCLIAGGHAAHIYVDEHRYASPEYDRASLVALGRYVRGGRTGVAGMGLIASFYGSELQGEAEYIADVGADHEVQPPATCTRWREKLRDRELKYVVVIRRFPDDTEAERAIAWTQSIPGVRVTMSNSAGMGFVLPGVVTTEGCP
jgi:hypothetical protein